MTAKAGHFFPASEPGLALHLRKRVERFVFVEVFVIENSFRNRYRLAPEAWPRAGCCGVEKNGMRGAG